VLVLLALPLALLAFAALLGLGLLRELPVPLAAGTAVVGLGSAAAGLARPLGGRLPAFWVSLAVVAVVVLVLLPRYLPGERAPALLRGLERLGAPERLAAYAVRGVDWFGIDRVPSPEPPPAAAPPQAEPERNEIVSQPVAAPPSVAAEIAAVEVGEESADERIPLRRAGEHLLVSAHLESRHGADDLLFLVDTGAALTTLTEQAAEAVELEVTDASPVVVLNGIGGQSEGRLTVVDTLWLGDHAIGPLTVAVCDDCLPTSSEGLLGIDVLDRFATAIDADRLELRLRPSNGSSGPDLVTPFLEVDAQLRVLPNGELLGGIDVRSVAPADIADLRLTLSCPNERFEFSIERLPPHGEEHLDVALPWGTHCPEFRTRVDSARWE